MNKKFLLIMIVALGLTLIGFTHFSAQLTPAEFDALRTEVAATVYGEIYSTVYWQFSAQSTQAALAPASPGVTGVWAGRLEADADRLFVHGKDDEAGQELHADQDVRRLEDELDV